MLQHDCFISYARSDLAHAEVLHQRLIAAGFSVWFDIARMREGCDWHNEIREGCESSRVVLPVLTPRWKLSNWTRYETYGAETIIPVLAEGSLEEVITPPLRLLQIKSVPLAMRSDDEWVELFASIRTACLQSPPVRAQRLTVLRYEPNKCFVGRERCLEEVHERLFAEPAHAPTQGRVQVITALGGMGKTTLAREYAEKFWRCYQQIFWVDCGKLEGDFADISDRLKLEKDPRAAKDPQYLKAIRTRDYLNSDGSLRLLILDDATDQQSVRQWIPRIGRCHTIVTSRFTDWAADEMYAVWLLEPKPARELLLRRAGKAETDAEITIVDLWRHQELANAGNRHCSSNLGS
jgi:hypothetical protein